MEIWNTYNFFKFDKIILITFFCLWILEIILLMKILYETGRCRSNYWYNFDLVNFGVKVIIKFLYFFLIKKTFIIFYSASLNYLLTAFLVVIPNKALLNEYRESKQQWNALCCIQNGTYQLRNLMFSIQKQEQYVMVLQNYFYLNAGGANIEECRR